MSERREPGFNLDQLAEPVPTLEPEKQTPHVPKSSSNSTVNPPNKSGGLGAGIAVIALLVAVGMAVWNYQLTQKMDQQSVLLEQMNLWLESTDATLTKTTTSASQSGETLSSRLEQLNGRVEDRIKHFDSEIAKLWTVSYQRNKPQLEKQGETIEAQAKLIQSQTDSINSIQSGLEQIQEQAKKSNDSVVTLSKSVSEFENSLKKRDQQLSKLNDLFASKDKQIVQLNERVAQLNSDLEFQLSIERDERARLSEQLDQVKSGSSSSDIDGRIATIEERLRSIDSSRQSVNAELLNIKQQLNTLLLEGAIR